MSASGRDLTVLFARLRNGDGSPGRRHGRVVYGAALAGGPPDAGRNRRHTLQPTALVNEAYLRLMRGPDVINDRQHFLALAAQAMRRVLVDHARQKRAGKRGGGLERVTLELVPGREPIDVDVLALDEALDGALEARSARAAGSSSCGSSAATPTRKSARSSARSCRRSAATGCSPARG